MSSESENLNRYTCSAGLHSPTIPAPLTFLPIASESEGPRRPNQPTPDRHRAMANSEHSSLAMLSKMTLDVTHSTEQVVKGGVHPPLPRGEQIVNPWEIVAADEYGIDYDKLTEKFGTRKIDHAILDRFEKLTGHKPHRYLRRGLFFSQRYHALSQ